MRWAALVVSLGIAISLGGCTSQSTPKPEQQSETGKPAHHKADTLAKDLDVPWNIIKHGNVFYISERPGKIVKLTSGGKVIKMPLHLKKKVVQDGEGGLLGFVLSPDFNHSHTAYIYHTYRKDRKLFNRIVKIKWANNSWTEQKALVDHIPAASIHNGGRLKIGPDGKLYATAGDASVGENAQDLESFSGKVLRTNRDGSIPDGNPYPHSYVYSYGHRNPEGLAWSKDGIMYDAEHGPTAHDEINRIEPGKNYGWPVIYGSQTHKDMVSPLFQSGEDTWAPSGLAYRNGALYAAGLRGEQIRRFDLKHHTSKVVFQGVGRLRDIVIDKNFAYVITNNTDSRGNPKSRDDRLLKIPLDRLK